jgi:hypothetical protein
MISSRELVDSSGDIAGRYTVWLKRENALLKLVSVGRIGGAEKTIEAVIEKAGFPDSDADPRLKTVSGLDGLVAAITNNATDVFDTASIRDYGSAAEYKVAVVSGDAAIGGGTGYGILLVRGVLDVRADFTWNGLILVIGTGIIHWNGFTGAIHGGLCIGPSIEHTTADPVFTITDAAEIRKANGRFPYNPVAFREK